MAQSEPPPSGSAGAAWEHDHSFHVDASAAERGTRAVVWITLATMVVEILAGWWFNSMALLADGWHMSSHAVAIGVSAFAYAAARRLAQDRSFAFGTWKIEVLGGFASAILLLGVALVMLAGSAERLLSPQPIQYREALLVTVLGLLVNLVCALILQQAHGQDVEQGQHSHSHGHSHGHSHHASGSEGDLNLRSAYTHVLADAATSVLAILALAGGWWLGWSWLDPTMGMVGSVLVASWAIGLARDSSRALLDREMDHPIVQVIRETLDFGEAATRLSDLHVWRVGRHAWACTVTLVTADAGLSPAQVRQRLAAVQQLAHSTIEIHRTEPPG